MTTEQKLKEMILEEYRSILAFSEKAGLPYSTIDSIFKRGMQNSSVANVIKICKELKLDADELAEGRVVKKKDIAIEAAAARFDTDKLTPEGRRIYENTIKFLAETHLSKD